MATQNTVNIGINVSDNGSAKKVIKSFQDIEQAANRAQKSANMGMPAGGTAGSRAVYAKTAPTGSQQLLSGTEYNRGRGSMGATGASARDFANQSQGLGGLVRLYATYAANVFAAGAAFRALSSAMDTTNMVRGLDQIGAASGTALGSLSKQLVATTQGAISLREAMEATAKASSSGMSSENILRMGKAAMQASQALGVNMSDAVSRLSRGITKLEPELLDELGIFVRIDDVVKKYADSTGKAASSITDFEKRQAFANAVLDQAEKKFGAIQIDINPYTKLAATIADLGQGALEMVNKGIGPLVSLLSSSPTALSVVLAGIASTIVKQAIPAVTDFRAGLAKAAEESKAISQKKLQDVKSSLGAETALRIQALDDAAEAEFTRFEASSKKLMDLKASNAKKLAKYDKEALRISQLDPADITPENIAYLEDLAKKQTKVSQVYKQIALDITAYKEVEKEYNKAQKERNIILTEQHPLWSTIGQNEKVYHDEVNASRQRSASSQIAYTASTRGFVAGIREALGEFKSSREGIVTTMDLLDESGKKTGTTLTTTTKGLGLFSRSLNLAKNTAVGMTAALGTAINAFAPWLQVFGILVAAGGALISWMSKTQEESAATAAALTAIKDATKNLADTLDVIEKKPLLEQFDPRSIAARATAIGELTDQIRKGFDSAYKELDKMGGSDRFVNWVSKLWSGDVESELSEQVSAGLARVFNSINESSVAGKAAAKTIRDILKIDDISSIKEVNEALDGMTSAERRRSLDLISASIKSMGSEFRISAARGTELVAAFDKAQESLTKFKNSFMQKDPTSEYGQNLVDVFFKLGAALNDPEQKLAAIKTLADRIKEVPAPTSLVIGLQDISKEIDRLNQVTKAIATIDAEIYKLQSTAKSQVELTDLANKTNISAGQALSNINAQIAALKANREVKVGLQLDLRAQVDNASELVSKAQLAVFKTGADLVANKISTEWAKAGATVTNAVAGVLSGTEAGIKMRAESEKTMLSVQAEQIKVQRAQILATEANTLALDEDRLSRDKQNMDLKGTASDEANKKIREREAQLAKRREQLESAMANKSQKGTYADLAAKIAGGAKDITTDMLNLAQSLDASGAQLANINAQVKALNISTKDQLIQVEYKKRGENLQLLLNSLKIEQDLVSAGKEINSEINIAGILRKQSLETNIAEFNYQKANLAFEVEITRQRQAQSNFKKGTTQFTDIEKEIQRVNSLKKANEEAYAGNIVVQGLRNRIELINAESKISAQASNDKFVKESRILDTKQAQLEATERLLDAETAAGRFTAEFTIREKARLDQSKAQINYAKEISVAQNAQKTSLDEINRREKELNAAREARIAKFDQEAQGFDTAIEYTDAELAAQKELTAERGRINDTYTNTTEKAKSTLDILLQILGITRENNLQQERYNQLLSAADGIAESLKGAFDGASDSAQRVATALGDVAKNMAQAAINAEKRAQSEAAAQKSVDKAWDTMDYDTVIAAEKQQADIRKKNAKQQLSDDINSINSAKRLFKEKTFAYKALAAIEKVMHLTRLAMDIKEMFSDTAKTGTSIANSVSRTGASVVEAGVDGVKAVIKAISSMPFPLNIAAGAATAAVVAGLISKIGGKGPGAAGFTPTAEQRQDTQGTAMGYDSQGNKVQVRRGVFGDTDAKSESIANSLEIIRDNSVAGLSYDNKMLRALQDLNQALGSAAKELFGIRGLRAGSLAGTVEGTNTSAGLFGISGLFGKTTTKSIIDSGIQIQGSFYDLARGISGTIKTFETVSTTVKKSGFFGIGGSTRTSIATTFKDLYGIDPQAFQSLTNAFDFAADTLYDVANTAGVASDVVTNALKTINVNEMASLRGLSGEAFTKELSAVIGSVLDDASLAIFASFETYAEFGEGMLETVIRVVDTNKKVNQALQNIGLSNALNRLSNDVTEALAKAAGGLDDLLSQYEFFSSNFLTKSEQTLPVQKAVINQLAAMGYASIDTKQEFVALVRSLDVTSAAGRKTYQELMDLAPGFNEVIETVKDQSQALKDSAENFRNFITQIKEFKSSLLLGSASTLTPEEKYAEAKSQFENLYSQALAGDSVAMTKVTSSAQSFLDASKTYFASSKAYTDDFNTVLNKLDAASVSAGASASVAELQLNALSIQTTLLEEINTNIATLAGVPKAARGGMVSGLTMVGELGPELVDFSYPGRVYPANETRGMFAPQQGINTNMNQVVQELRQVKQEIAQLRKDQQQQTGDLIVSNYDANQQASKEVATAVVDISSEIGWADRSKPQIK